MDTKSQQGFTDEKNYQSARMKSILRLTVSVAGYKFPYPRTSEIPPHNGHLMRLEQANSPVYKALYDRFQDEVASITSPVRFRSSILDGIKMSNSSIRRLPFSTEQNMDRSLSSSDVIYTSDDNLASINNSAETEITSDDDVIDVEEWEERALTVDLDTLNPEVKKTASQRIMALFRKDGSFPYFNYKKLTEEKCPEYEFTQQERKLKDEKNKKRSVLSVVRQMGRNIKRAVSRQ